MQMFGLPFKLVILGCLLTATLIAHEGHHLLASGEDWLDWMRWIGRLHFDVLHFPIALIIMTGVAELLFYGYRYPQFEQAAYFMIVAAAIWSVPTVLLGFFLSYGAVYGDVREMIFQWHRYLGIVTMLLAILTAYLRYDYFAKRKKSLNLYYMTLLFLFLSVSLTGALGGSLAFG